MPIETNQLALPGIAPADLPSITDPVVCTCPSCGGEFDEEDGITPEDTAELHCADCVNACEECGDYYSGSDEIQMSRRPGRRNADTCLCSSCRWECADCNNHFHPDCSHYQNADGEDICESCADSYRSCDDCNDVIHEDDSNYHAGREATLCNACYRAQCNSDDEEESDEEESEEQTRSAGPLCRINDYSYKPHAIFHRADGEKQAGAIYFGLEIECEYIGNESRLNGLAISGLADQQTWYAKRDGSLNEHTGVEMVSHPGTWQYWAASSFELLAKMQKARFRSYDTSTCGMHVHISRSAFTDLQVWKLLEFFRRNDKLLTRLSRRQGNSLEQWAGINKGPGGRSSTCAQKLIDQAAPLTRYDPEILDYVEVPGRRKVRKKEWCHSDRYAAINLENRATVEIRIFRGTLGIGAIKRNIALCAALVAFVRYTDINNLSQADFVRFLATEGTKSIGRQWSSGLITWIAGRCEDTDATC